MNITREQVINGYNMVKKLIKYIINVKIKIVHQRKLFLLSKRK